MKTIRQSSTSFATRLATRWLCSTTTVFFAGLAALSVAQPTHAADDDGDGVDSTVDAFPCDATTSAVQFVPAQNQTALLAYEDQWPSNGDLDFNDVVVSYHYQIFKNAAGNVTKIVATYTPVANGGLFSNGLAVRIPVAANTISSVSLSGGSSSSITPVVSGAQTVLKITNNLRDQFVGGASGTINSVSGQARNSATPLVVTIQFATAQTINTALAPFDVFIFRSDNNSHEIHFPQFDGTSNMDQSLFLSLDDASTTSRRFVNAQGLPFALHVPAATVYPQENTRIDALFPRIVNFAASGGTTDTDFFSNGVVNSNAFRDSSNITTPNINAPAAPVANTSCVVTCTPVAGATQWWSAENNFANRIGGGATGSPTAGMSFAAGIRGQGFSFSSSNFITIAASAAAFGSSNFTVSYWMKTAAPNNVGVFSKRAACSHANMIDMRLGPGAGGSFGIEIDEPYTAFGAGANLGNNQFHHVVLVRNGTQVRFYQDGVLTSTASGSVASIDSVTPVFLGKSTCTGSDGTGFYTGVLDEIVLFNRALSDSEVSNLLINTRDGVCLP